MGIEWVEEGMHIFEEEDEAGGGREGDRGDTLEE